MDLFHCKILIKTSIGTLNFARSHYTVKHATSISFSYIVEASFNAPHLPMSCLDRAYHCIRLKVSASDRRNTSGDVYWSATGLELGAAILCA